jgi:very-short-patch-repair endonuclease
MRNAEVRSQAHARRLRQSMTDAETILWIHIRKCATGARFRRQHPIGPFIADFACIAAKLVIEVDGATHGRDARDYDQQREAFLAKKGWRVLRVSNEDVYRNLDGVWRTILASLPPSALRATPPACGGRKAVFPLSPATEGASDKEDGSPHDLR